MATVQLRNRQFLSHRTVQARAQSGAAWRVSVEGAWRCLQLRRVEFAPLSSGPRACSERKTMRTKTLPKIAASLFALFVFAVSQPASAAAPTATTQAASSITSTSAQLNSYVNPNGASTTIYFQYGLTTSYGSTTTSGSIGTSTGNYGTTVSGLTANTVYHFRIVAYSSGGTSYGGDLTFTTSPQPPTATTQAASSITSASAQLNSYVNPNGASTTIYFQYGLTTSYGSASSSVSPIRARPRAAVTRLALARCRRSRP